MDVREAAQPDAHQLWTQSPGNCCFEFQVGDAAATEAAISAAPTVVRLSSDNGRLVQNPLETRGYVGSWDAIEELYTLHAAAGKPQTVGRDLAHFIFGLPEDRVRAVVKDVGGGFGAKNPLYPEQALVLWTAKKLGRPVRWQASRSETFLADYQAEVRPRTRRWLSTPTEGFGLPGSRARRSGCFSRPPRFYGAQYVAYHGRQRV